MLVPPAPFMPAPDPFGFVVSAAQAVNSIAVAAQRAVRRIMWCLLRQAGAIRWDECGLFGRSWHGGVATSKVDSLVSLCSPYRGPSLCWCGVIAWREARCAPERTARATDADQQTVASAKNG